MKVLFGFLFLVIFLMGSDGYDVRDDSEWSLWFHYLTFSYSAYCNPQSIEEWTCPWCVMNGVHGHVRAFLGNEDINLFGFVFETDDEIIVAFRGTQMESLENWETNLNFIQVPYVREGCQRCQVHKGFYKSYDSIKMKLIETVEEIHHRSSYKKISVTGHSMGGAVATLAAIDFAAEENLHIEKLITFGSPRVGNAAFVSWFLNTVIDSGNITISHRITNKEDIVTVIPFTWMGYLHIPFQVRFTSPKNYTWCRDSIAEDPNCNNFRGGNTDDHHTYLGMDLQSYREECQGRTKALPAEPVQK